MKRRELDIRLSEHGRRALIGLQRHYAAARPGELLRILVAASSRPAAGSYGRGEALARMRATVDARLADDLACLAAAEGVPLERYVEALIVTAHAAIFAPPAPETARRAAVAVPLLCPKRA